jgi:hypothetical protein
MAVQSHATIESELRKAHIARDDTMRCARIASAIVGTREFFGEREAARVRAKIAQDYVGAAADEAMEDALLSGSWVAINREMRERYESGPVDPNEKGNDSSLRHVTERNPYGWKNPDAHRAFDTDEPGAWNGFRQARNLTTSERNEQGSVDHRVRGCTRWEALGRTGQPKAHFDAMQVATAMAQASAAPAVAGARGIYGEGAS